MKRFAALVALLAPTSVLAHDSSGAFAGEFWLLLPLFLTGAWYVVGFFRLRFASRIGVVQHGRRALMFAAGWATIAASLLTPLHELGRHSFTLHMIEHELLMLVAAPLLALSRPIGVFVWALPKRWRIASAHAGRHSVLAGLWRFITGALVVTILQAIAMWAWHAPALFDRALHSEGWHAAQHLSFLFSAILFWWGITHAVRGPQGFGVAALYLFMTALHTGLLGALMSFSSSPWYSGYAAMQLGSIPFGLTVVEDQQLAGLVMWIPGGTIHAGAALAYVALWLRRMDQSLESSHALTTK